MTGVEVDLDDIAPEALIAISNAANVSLCGPIAARVAASAGAGFEARSYPRTSLSGWARSVVVATTFDAMRREARHGVLSRAMGRA